MAKDRQNAAQAARELGKGASPLRTWITAAESAANKGKGLAFAFEEKQEMGRLRKRIAEAEEELEIIKNSDGVFRLGSAEAIYAWIGEMKVVHSIDRMYQFLKVGRSSY